MYKFTSENNEFKFLNFFGKNEHVLTIRVRPEYSDDRDIVGYYPFNRIGLVKIMSVTARGLNRGGIKIGSLDLNKQYGEIGPGFSGYFPTYQNLPLKKPTIFDPISYETFLPIIEEAIEEIEKNNSEIIQKLTDSKWIYEGLIAIKKNCLFYMNPENVIRYQMTFREAMQKDPKLHKHFDQIPFCSFSANHYDGSPTKRNSKDSHQNLIELCLKK